MTKLLFAVFRNNKRFTRWRTDKLKTLGIARKSSSNDFTSGFEVKKVSISKRIGQGSFAMIANQVSPL